MGALAILLLSGCSDVNDAVDRAQEEAAGISESAVGEAVERRVRDELARAGIDLAEGPTCDPDIDLSGLDVSNLGDGVAGSVQCSGRTQGGDDVEARFTGEFGVTSCRGELVVTVAGEEHVRSPDLPLCSG